MVWNYQGAIPDVKMLEIRREELQDRFDELYRLLNRETVIKARRDKIARLTGTVVAPEPLDREA
jgi:hypothetical protein